MPSEDQCTSSPRKQCKEPKSLTGKRAPSFEIKLLQTVGFGQVTKILSTYTKTITSEGANVTKREQSDRELEKPKDTKA